jgi:hypothetical protein
MRLWLEEKIGMVSRTGLLPLKRIYAVHESALEWAGRTGERSPEPVFV